MENKYFSLEIRDDNNLTKIFRIIFGLICCAIAIFWVIYNIRSVTEDRTLWITVAFLIAFGVFQIYAGFGLATKYIEFGQSAIKLKKNSLLPVVELTANQIERVELFPLKVVFCQRAGKKVLLRFGISDPDKIELIKAEIINFSDSNNLKLEIISEEI
jgi:small-conductance mechanosensitive channel